MTPDDVKNESNRSHVRALARGLDTLKALGTVTEGATLSDIAAIVDLDRATTRRFLLTLCDLGYVRQSKKRFYMAPKVLELGYAYFSTMSKWEAIQPILNEFCDRTLGTISIGVQDGDEVIYVARAQSNRSVYAINVTVGSRFPIYSSSIGRIILAGRSDADLRHYLSTIDLVKRTPHTVTDIDEFMAGINRIREQGYSISDQETELGVRSIAIPIHGRDGGVVAGLNSSVATTFASVEDLVTRFLPLLRETAQQIEPAMQIEK